MPGAYEKALAAIDIAITAAIEAERKVRSCRDEIGHLRDELERAILLVERLKVDRGRDHNNQVLTRPQNGAT